MDAELRRIAATLIGGDAGQWQAAVETSLPTTAVRWHRVPATIGRWRTWFHPLDGLAVARYVLAQATATDATRITDEQLLRYLAVWVTDPIPNAPWLPSGKWKIRKREEQLEAFRVALLAAGHNVTPVRHWIESETWPTDPVTRAWRRLTYAATPPSDAVDGQDGTHLSWALMDAVMALDMVLGPRPAPGEPGWPPPAPEAILRDLAERFAAEHANAPG